MTENEIAKIIGLLRRICGSVRAPELRHRRRFQAFPPRSPRFQHPLVLVINFSRRRRGCGPCGAGPGLRGWGQPVGGSTSEKSALSRPPAVPSRVGPAPQVHSPRGPSPPSLTHRFVGRPRKRLPSAMRIRIAAFLCALCLAACTSTTAPPTPHATVLVLPTPSAVAPTMAPAPTVTAESPPITRR